MDRPTITPICGYDIAPDGTARPVTDPWPHPDPAEGQAYRWLHFDLATEGLETWITAHLPEIPARALRQVETRPRCDPYEGGLILNLRGVNLNPGADPDDMVSVRLWVTGRHVISARVRKVWAVDALDKRMAAGAGPGNAIGFVAELAGALTRRIESVSLELEDATDDAEEAALASSENLSARIAPIRQSVIKLRRYVAPQREALEILAGGENPLHGEGSAEQFREIANRATRTVEELEATRDRLTALHDHMTARHETSQSRNGYVLSVVAAIFLPLGFLTGLFGVNVGGMPGIDSPSAFWLLSGISTLIGVALFAVFRMSKWL